MRVKWLRKAAQNLEDAYDYLAKDNPKVAQAFVQDVYRLVNLLPVQPAMGRAGRVVGTREQVIQDYPFIIPYRVSKMKSIFYGYSTRDYAYLVSGKKIDLIAKSATSSSEFFKRL
ncbi:type II toxin-antitoxin system RelE/ParE family toxin [Shewanella putrefaciens]|nr:type II toxin-antitoxin system RelE/ParE family toxin [Shewanella putrefaciens]